MLVNEANVHHAGPNADVARAEQARLNLLEMANQRIPRLVGNPNGMGAEEEINTSIYSFVYFASPSASCVYWAGWVFAIFRNALMPLLLIDPNKPPVASCRNSCRALSEFPESCQNWPTVVNFPKSWPTSPYLVKSWRILANPVASCRMLPNIAISLQSLSNFFKDRQILPSFVEFRQI